MSPYNFIMCHLVQLFQDFTGTTAHKRTSFRTPLLNFGLNKHSSAFLLRSDFHIFQTPNYSICCILPRWGLAGNLWQRLCETLATCHLCALHRTSCSSRRKVRGIKFSAIGGFPTLSLPEVVPATLLAPNPSQTLSPFPISGCTFFFSHLIPGLCFKADLLFRSRPRG